MGRTLVRNVFDGRDFVKPGRRPDGYSATTTRARPSFLALSKAMSAA